MLTYDLGKYGKIPLYDALYRSIKQDILSGAIAPGKALPSKRSLSDHLQVSRITVENAYAQLLAEGYITARERVGYFAEEVDSRPHSETAVPRFTEEKSDEKSATEASSLFPASVYNRIIRQVISSRADLFEKPADGRGVFELRRAISGYLYRMRGMNADPDYIIVGAGTEYLYQLLINLLGRDARWAVENPGYGKIREIFKLNGLDLSYIDMDENGIKPSELLKSGARILHATPSHHFPTGIITPIQRRHELLSWAEGGRYILEDDYDSEFRFSGKPIPTLESSDTAGRVVYLNTFSRTISPALRISYMVLPRGMKERYENVMGFYSSTVPSLEQYALARFIDEGHYERHIARMKTYYRRLREAVLQKIPEYEAFRGAQISGKDTGLHFLIKLRTGLGDDELARRLKKSRMNISCLSQYYLDPAQSPPGVLVVDFSSLTPQTVTEALDELNGALKDGL